MDMDGGNDGTARIWDAKAAGRFASFVHMRRVFPRLHFPQTVAGL